MRTQRFLKIKHLTFFMLLLNLCAFPQSPLYFSADKNPANKNGPTKSTQQSFVALTPSRFNDDSLYKVDPAMPVKTVRLNFIFLQRDDGTGNFSESNPEHQQMLNDIVSRMNSLMANLNTSSCGGINSHAKIQFEVNKLYIKDAYLWNNENDHKTFKCPDRINWYLKNKAFEIDHDSTIPKGIDVFFTNGLTAYTSNVINNDSAYRGANYACSTFPSDNLDDGSYIHMPDAYIKYFWMKNRATIQFNQPWIPVVYSWYVGLAGTIIHELGHSFNLVHDLTCTNHNIMDPSGAPTSFHDYLSDTQLARINRSLSVTNVRKFVKSNSISGSVIKMLYKGNIQLRKTGNLFIHHRAEVEYSYGNIDIFQ
jgi:hypothetical protein